MYLLTVLLLISAPLWASEVATIQRSTLAREIQLSMTDEELISAGEKQFVANSCRFKTTMAMNGIKEISVPAACRAEITKFFINAGYKALDSRTFIK